MSSDQRQKRIAAVHDISGAGKCSLTVALPVISAVGVECSCIPTALLSTHTGEFEGYVIKDLSELMLPIAQHWRRAGIEADGIYSGYLASPEQAKLLEGIIDELATDDTLVIIDPVMADNGVYYSNLDERMCRAFRGLCRRADVLTPNMTEAALLTGLPYMPAPHGKEYIAKLIQGLLNLGAKTVALTGVSPEEGVVGNAIAREGEEPFYSLRPARAGVFYGTGDLFASALSALLVLGVDEKGALEAATELVDNSVHRTIERGTERRYGVDFEGALRQFADRTEQLINKCN